jgi:hypothetical protein
MRKILPALALLLTAATVAWVTVPDAQESIEGTWLVTSEDGSHQRGAFMFTSDGSYAQMWVRGDEPRAVPQDDWTDADWRASAREVTANMGRLTINGNELVMEAYMANGASYMAGWPDNDQTATYELAGDRMTLTLQSGRVFHLRRP